MTWLVVAGIMLAAFGVLWLIGLTAHLFRGEDPIAMKHFYGCETGSVNPVPRNFPEYCMDICEHCRRIFQTKPINLAHQLTETCGRGDCPLRDGPATFRRNNTSQFAIKLGVEPNND